MQYHPKYACSKVNPMEFNEIYTVASGIRVETLIALVAKENHILPFHCTLMLPFAGDVSHHEGLHSPVHHIWPRCFSRNHYNFGRLKDLLPERLVVFLGN